jgi:bla regulator protein BlaR1
MQSFLSLALSNALLATVLALLAAVVTRVCRRPVVRHALWLLVLLKLITPPLFPLSVAWPRSEENESPAAEPPQAVVVLPSESDSSEPFESESGRDARAPESEPNVRDARLIVSPPSSPPLIDYWIPALFVVWLGGALTWWTVVAARLGQFQRCIRQTSRAPVEVQEQSRRTAKLLGLRRCPPVVFVSAPLSPMLWALGLSPRLLLPEELWHKLTAEQQDTLLAHELAHLRRGDHWVRRLELVVLGLYWWHPVVWWARRRLQEAEEECCDALVVAVLPDAAPAYASALVETVTFLSQTRPAVLVGTSGAGQVPLLKRRLTMILSETPSRKPSRIAFWSVLGLGALLLPLAPQAARTEALEEPKQKETEDQIGSPIQTQFAALLKAQNLSQGQEVFRPQDCAACHKVATLQNHDFHGMSDSWRHAHDEIIRLAKELAQSREAAKRSPAASEPDRTQEIEKLQDEIELLKVQVRLKEATVEGAKQTLKEYQVRLANYEQVKKNAPGSIPNDTIQELWLMVITNQSKLRVNEAELQESLVRIKQAERRLARLQRPKPRTESAGPSKQQQEFFVQPFAQPTSWNVTWAEVLFDRRTVDLPIVQGTPVSFKFVMTNRGKYLIHIEDIRTSAACLSAVASKNELKPGETAAIEARLDTSRIVGRKIFQVFVQFDKPDRQQVVLEVRANTEAAPPARAKSPERLQELEKKLDELRKEMDNLRREMRPPQRRDPDPEHSEAQGFIDRVWPTLDTALLEHRIPKAQQAFQRCKAVGDRASLVKLLIGCEGHVKRLTRESAALQPDLVIDDEKEAKKLKRVSDQIVKLRQDIQDYLKVHPDDK